MRATFPFFKQHDQMDCGATCLRMIFKYYGKNVSIQKIRRLCQSNQSGVNMLGISQAEPSVRNVYFTAYVRVEDIQPVVSKWVVCLKGGK